MDATTNNQVEAERGVIRQCVEGPATGGFTRSDALGLTLSSLTAADFTDDTNRKIYTAIQRATGNSPNPETSVSDVEMLLSNDYLKGSLYEICGEGGANFTETGYAKVLSALSEATLGRNILTMFDEVEDTIASAPKDGLNKLLEGTYELMRDRHTTQAQHISVYIPEAKEEVDRRSERGGTLGFRCGIPAIDNHFQGVQKGMLHVIGARPKMGKSLVGMQMSFTLSDPAFDGGPVRTLVVSPEMTPLQYMARIATARAGVNWNSFKEGRLWPDDRDRVKEELDYMRQCDLIIDPSGAPTISSIRQAVILTKPQVLFVDYLQLVQPDNPSFNEYKDVTEVSKALNAFKKDFDLAVIVAAQLNRNVDNEDRKDKRPILSDLRSSGQIEQDADRALGLYRDARYYESTNDRDEPVDKDSIDFICMKDRHGEEWSCRQWIRSGRMWIVGRDEDLEAA